MDDQGVVVVEGRAFLRKPDGTFVELGQVEETEATLDQVRSRTTAHAVSPMEDPALMDEVFGGLEEPAPFSGYMSGDPSADRPGQGNITDLVGGWNREAVKAGGETELQQLVGQATPAEEPEPAKSLSERIGDIAGRATSAFSTPKKAEAPPMPVPPELKKKKDDKEA